MKRIDSAGRDHFFVGFGLDYNEVNMLIKFN